MKRIICIIAFFISTILISCVTPVSKGSYYPNANINAYKYVFVVYPIYENRVIDRFDIGRYIEQELRKIGFTIIDNEMYSSLDPDDKQRVIVCEIEHNHSSDGMGGSYANVYVNFYDSLSNIIYTGYGKYQGLSIYSDLIGATELAIDKLVSEYEGFDSYYETIESKHIRKLIAKRENTHLTSEDISYYLDNNLSQLSDIEGIWVSEDGKYEVGIIKGNDDRDYLGIIINTSSNHWDIGLIKMEFYLTAYKNVYLMNYYLENHEQQQVTAIIDEYGLLQFNITIPDNSLYKSLFLKKYPNFNSGNRITRSGSGTGFLLSNDGFIATNYHVVLNSNDITVTFPNSLKEYKATVQIKDTNSDIAVLKLENFDYNEISLEDIPYSYIKSKDIKVGESIIAIGYPFGTMLDDQLKVTDGIISSKTGIEGDARLLQITAPIQPGNSGGPLFNDDGNIIGIVSSTLNPNFTIQNNDYIPQNVNFAIKIEYLTNLLDMLNIEYNVDSTQIKYVNDIESIVEEYAKYVALIEVK